MGRKGTLNKALLVVFFSLLLALKPAAVSADSGNLIDDFVMWNHACVGSSGGWNQVWADLYDNVDSAWGYSYETEVFLYTESGYGIIMTNLHSPDKDYFFTAQHACAADSQLPLSKGIILVRFVDMTNPLYLPWDISTYTYTSVPSLSISAVFNTPTLPGYPEVCSGETENLFGSVSAYRDLSQVELIGEYTGSGTYHFSDLEGIKEIALTTDYCINYLDSLVIYLYGETPEGEDITVPVEDDTSGEAILSVTFDTIDSGGITSLATSTDGTAPPSGFKLGDPATWYDVSTTADYAGTVEVCLDYSGISYDDESSLKMFHYEDPDWVDVTSSLDTDNDVICGMVSELSLFAALEVETGDNGGGGGGCSTTTDREGGSEGLSLFWIAMLFTILVVMKRRKGNFRA